MKTRPVWRRRVTEFGTLPSQPTAAVVIAAGEAPEHLHAVLSMLFSEPGGRNVEIVIHHAEGPATELVRRTAASLSAIHRAGIRLVSVSAEAFAAERLRAALAETRAAKVLALGSGALPSAAGWLAAWKRRTAAGPTPSVVWVTAEGCDGSTRCEGDAVGMNAAAVARLISARPVLPGVDTDLRATPGLEQTIARGLSVTVFERRAETGLDRAAERLAAEAVKEAASA